MTALGILIFVTSAFVAAYMLGFIPPFLGSVPVRESTGQWIAVGSVVGIVIGFVLAVAGWVIS